MTFGIREYFKLKPERYKTNLNSFLLAYQQTFDGPGQSALQRIFKQTAPVLDLPRMKPGYQTKGNYTEVWRGSDSGLNLYTCTYVHIRCYFRHARTHGLLAELIMTLARCSPHSISAHSTFATQSRPEVSHRRKSIAQIHPKVHPKLKTPSALGKRQLQNTRKRGEHLVNHFWGK